jgi:serine/threonine-protein kinase
MSHENHAAGASDPLCGTSYAMKGLLGCGNMGLVVEAEHIALGVPVVVKLLHKELAGRADFVERMRLEAQALARLRSPHLVAVSDFSVTPEGQPFFVMERLHGATVAEELAVHGPFSVHLAIDIVRQVLAGLEVAHAAGIVHRDIKPANVFVCRRESPGARRLVKILDFGIAKVLASVSNGVAPAPLRFPTAEGHVVGTPRCLSPEQARAKPVDARTDIYAVGVLLYALLTGAGPFDHVKGALQLIEAHANTVPPPPSARAPEPTPRELDEAVMRALAKAPDDRFASAAMFAAALAWIAGRLRPAAPAGKPTARRFGTELVAPGPGGTPPPSPSYARNAPAPVPPTARRFGTELVAAAPGGAPPPSPLYAANAPAHVAAPRPIVLALPGQAPPALAPEAQTVVVLKVGAPRHRHGAMVAALCMVTLALMAVERLAARAWAGH